MSRPQQPDQKESSVQSASVPGVVTDGRTHYSKGSNVRQRQQQTVAEIGQLALSGGPLLELFDEVARRIVELLDVGACKILEFDSVHSIYHVVADGDKRTGVCAALTCEATLADRALSHNEPQIVENVKECHELYGCCQTVCNCKIESGLTVPLGRSDWTRGVISAQAHAHRTFSDEDIHFVHSLANILTTAINRRRVEEELRYRVSFDNLISSLSTQFISLTLDEMEGAIHAALAQIGEFAGVDRSYIFQFSDDRTRSSCTHEWCREGIAPAIDRLQNITVDDMPWAMTRHLNGDLLHIPDVADLPPEAAREKAELDSENIKSLIGVPLSWRGESIGFVGFDAVRERKVWSDETIALLKIVGDMFVNTLQRQRSESALLESQRRLTQVVSSLPLVVYSAEAMTNHLRVLEGDIERIYGYSREEIVENPNLASGCVPDEDVEQVNRLWEEGLNSGQPFEACFRVRNVRTREIFWLQAHVVPVCDDDGNLLWQDGIVIDVTEQKRAEEAIQESEARYRNLFEKASDAIFIIKGEQFVDCNSRAEDLYGRRREEILGKSPVDFSPAVQAGGVPTGERLQQVAGRVSAGESVTFEWQHVRPNGETFEVEVTLNRVELAGSEVLQAIVRDITERKRAEQEKRHLELQVQHAQKLESLGVLAGGIAHDFNNLLTGIMGNAGLALMNLPHHSPAEDSLVEVEKTAQRAADLCKQMLAYSGKGRFVIQPVNLTELVQEMAYMLETAISKKAVLQLNLAESLPPVEVDATQIRQVVMNLITNASDAIGDQPGVISVTTGLQICDRAYLREAYLDEDLVEGAYAFVEVSDTGCGMTPETRAKIFEPFFTTKFTGRGLGLAAVLGIVRGHQGAMHIMSDLGHGSTFKVLLPISESTNPVSSVSDKDAGATADVSGGILVVDDENTIRGFVDRCLQGMGFQVYLAADGREGVDLFNQYRENIDLVLLDMTMPEMDGEEVFREIRRVDSQVKVVLTSGYSEQEVTSRFDNNELAGFLQKPFRAGGLLDTIQSVLKTTGSD